MLYQQYVVRKAAMDAFNPEVQIERMLWHGTSADNLDLINRKGFHRSYCGKTGNFERLLICNSFTNQRYAELTTDYC